MDKSQLRFLLPDLLGKPGGFVNKKGEMVFSSSFEVPKDCYIFFIPIEEWIKYNSFPDGRNKRIRQLELRIQELEKK